MARKRVHPKGMLIGVIAVALLCMAISAQGARRLAQTGVDFVTKSTTESLGDGVRLATLQDANGPDNQNNLKKVITAGTVYLLVDGWVTASIQSVCGGCPPDSSPLSVQTGTDDRDDITNKLGVIDSTASDSDPQDGVDIVPEGADPNGMLQKYLEESTEPSNLALQPRGATFGPPLNKGQVAAVKDLISQWTQTALETGLKQKTFLTGDQGTRLDLQSNGAFDKVFKNPQTGQTFTVSCYQIAVQIGNSVYSSVIVPVNEFVSAGGVRKALFESFDNRQVVAFVPPPPRLVTKYNWLLAFAGAAGVIALIV